MIATTSVFENPVVSMSSLWSRPQSPVENYFWCGRNHDHKKMCPDISSFNVVAIALCFSLISVVATTVVTTTRIFKSLCSQVALWSLPQATHGR